MNEKRKSADQAAESFLKIKRACAGKLACNKRHKLQHGSNQQKRDEENTKQETHEGAYEVRSERYE